MNYKIHFLLLILFYPLHIFCAQLSINSLYPTLPSQVLPWTPSTFTFSPENKSQEPDTDEFESITKNRPSSPRATFAPKKYTPRFFLEWPKKVHRWMHPEIDREERLGIRQDGSTAYQQTLFLYEKIATASRTPAPLSPRSEEYCKQLTLDVMNQTQMLATQWRDFKQKGHMHISLENLCIGVAHLLNHHRPILSAPAIRTLENLHAEAISEMTKRLETCKNLTAKTCL